MNWWTIRTRYSWYWMVLLQWRTKHWALRTCIKLNVYITPSVKGYEDWLESACTNLFINLVLILKDIFSLEIHRDKYGTSFLISWIRAFKRNVIKYGTSFLISWIRAFKRNVMLILVWILIKTWEDWIKLWRDICQV